MGFWSDKREIKHTGVEFKNVVCLSVIEAASLVETPLNIKIKAADASVIFIKYSLIITRYCLTCLVAMQHLSFKYFWCRSQMLNAV